MTKSGRAHQKQIAYWERNSFRASRTATMARALSALSWRRLRSPPRRPASAMVIVRFITERKRLWSIGPAAGCRRGPRPVLMTETVVLATQQRPRADARERHVRRCGLRLVSHLQRPIGRTSQKDRVVTWPLAERAPATAPGARQLRGEGAIVRLDSRRPEGRETSSAATSACQRLGPRRQAPSRLRPTFPFLRLVLSARSRHSPGRR